MNDHESVCEELDAIVAEGRSGELEVSKMAAEDLSGHGSNVVQ